MASSSGGQECPLCISLPLVLSSKSKEKLLPQGVNDLYMYIKNNLTELQRYVQTQLPYVHIKEIRYDKQIVLDFDIYTESELDAFFETVGNNTLQRCLTQYSFDNQFDLTAGYKEETTLVLNITLKKKQYHEYKAKLCENDEDEEDSKASLSASDTHANPEKDDRDKANAEKTLLDIKRDLEVPHADSSVKEKVQQLESNKNSLTGHSAPGSYPHPEAGKSSPKVGHDAIDEATKDDDEEKKKQTKQQYQQVFGVGPASTSQTHSGSVRKDIKEENMVPLIRKTFKVFVPNYKDWTLDYVKIASNSIKELNVILYKYRDLHEVMVDLPLEHDDNSKYNYQAKYTYHRWIMGDKEMIKSSNEYTVGQQHVHRDYFTDQDLEGVKAHLLDIINHYSYTDQMNDLCMQIEKVCSTRLPLDSAKSLIRELSTNVSTLPKSRSLLAVAIGNSFANTDIIYLYDGMLDVRMAKDILESLRKFKLTELPKSCSLYMRSVCSNLCKIAVKGKLWPLSYVHQCYPFLDENILIQQIQTFGGDITPDDDSLSDLALELCRTLYRTYVSHTYTDAQQSTANTLLEVVMRHLPLRVALNVYRFLNNEHGKGLSSKEQVLQATIYGCIVVKIQYVLTNTKKGNNFQQLLDNWKLIQKITPVPDVIKSKFEKGLVDMLRRITSSGVNHIAYVLREVCDQFRFFDHMEAQQELLEVVADSPNPEVHSIFITLVRKQTFHDVSAMLHNKVFIKWYERAYSTHSRTRSREGEDEILYMFGCLSDLLSIPSLHDRTELQNVLEDMTFRELKSHKLETVLRKADAVEKLSEKKVHAGAIFKKLVQALIKRKCPGQKPVDILLTIVGAKTELRVNSSFTADIVCTILDVYCDLSEANEVEMFSSLMQNVGLWKLVMKGNGTKMFLIKENKQYQKACTCLEAIVKLFRQHGITYNFVQRLASKAVDAKYLIVCGGCTINEINKLWRDAEMCFKEELDKLTCVSKVMSEVKTKILNDEVPEGFLLPQGFSTLLLDVENMKAALARGELRAKDCVLKNGLWKGMTDLPVTCEYLDSKVSSQVFWNMCTVAVCKEFMHYTNDKTMTDKAEDELTLETVSSLFGEMQIEDDTSGTTIKPENDPGNTDVALAFLKMLLETGDQLYKKAWQEIQENDSVGMTFVMSMFRNADILNEIHIAQKCLRVLIKTDTKTALNLISKTAEIQDTVVAMKSSLRAFNIDFADDKTFIEAVQSFENLLNGDSADYTLSDIRLGLQTVFDIADGLSMVTINILNALGMCSSLLEFLQKIVEEDIRNLIDAVEDISEQHVRESTVSGLIEVKRFLHPLLRPEFDRKGKHLFRTVEKQTKDHGKAAISLPAKIEECMDNLHNLKSLYNNVANRGEQTKETIENIVNRGRFQFNLVTENKTCDFSASYKQPKKPRESRPKVALVDLRSRALLLMNTDRTESGKHLKNDDLEKFVTYVDLCLETADIAYNLYNSGHVKYVTFTKVEEPSGLIQLKRDLDDVLKTWQEHLHMERKSHFLMNFVQGTQIHTLYSYLEKGLEIAAVDTLLKYIHPNMKIDILKDVYSREKEVRLDSDEIYMLHCMGKSLHRSFEGLQLFQREVSVNKDQVKRITDVVQNGKLLVAHLDESSLFVVKTILALFANATHRLPEANQVLFCTRETRWSELELFLSRCLGASLFYGINTLFCIANVEMLPNEIQFKLVESLRHLKQAKDFLLAIVCRGSKNHPFIDELSDHVLTVRPSSDQTVIDIFSKECPYVCTFTSDMAGLGKTNAIRNRAHIIEKRVVSMHISGSVNKRTLVERLRDLHIDKDHVLHLDIGNVDSHVELDTFLFEMIILRHVSAGTVSVSLQTSHISIEIANTIKDSLRNSLQTAVSFGRIHLKWNDFSDFIVSKEVHSPIQVVCHFLHCLEKCDLDKRDLLFSGKNAVTPLSINTCRKLLKRYININTDLTFAIVNIFLNVLADQLKKMSCSAFFRTSRISDMIGHKTVPTVRSTLAKALLEVSREFSSRSVNACRSTQTSTLESGEIHDVDESNKLQDLASSATKRLEGMIQWEESNHLIYVFHNQNIQTISPMYRDESKVPDHIRKLFEGQMKKKLQDFKSMDQSELQKMLQKIARTDPMPLSQAKLQELARGYALTPDNLLKMVLIMLRIKAGIPVVVMGETGCGKTSLIRYLAGICEVPFDVMNIHAGVEEHAIIGRVVKNNTEALSNLNTERWLFLDEINTCEHLGLISDIICHHSCLGNVLSPNLVVMGACNPYKLRSTTAISTAGLQGKVKTDELSRLVYRVLPLPEMLVDYVWDFGSLSTKDEEIYIKRMVEDVFPGDTKHHSLLSDLLSMSQEFVRDQEKTSYSVSLRDVQRCKTLTVWFLSILKKRSEVSVKAGSEGNIPVRAMILSLAHCYHSRFFDKIVRKNYRCKMENKFNMIGMQTFKEDYIHEIIKKEQGNFLDRMELPPGTAKNTALRENVFVILVCILNKMPIFVVGKPGCSKSLAMQIIRSNLRGKDSKNELFKSLQQLYCVSFQGSESSTSDGIIKVFEKAEKYQQTNSADEVLSVVILDEIGLAEISRFNPLKVLHNLLEPDGQSVPNVAVVGISNWSLDASKMNRAIHLSRPEMDEDELFETGISISDSFVKSGRIHMFGSVSKQTFHTSDIKEELKGIAKSYFCYIRNLRFKNFHGLRDFYSLVKYVARELSESDRKMSQEERAGVIMLGIERNFGGLPMEKETLLNDFQLHLTNLTKVQIPVVELITNNIKDQLARHLMLITTGESVLGVVEERLTHIGRVRKEVIFGSQFEEDLTDDYNYRILSRIILCMEQGFVLVLKDLENIYGSLYDMLNQNYTVIGKKKNCRVALGPYSNPICHVNDTFRCIVLVDERKLDFTDPPFLNRFEKQYLRFADIISEDQEIVIRSIEAWIAALSSIKGKHFTNADTFPVYSEDMVASLVLKLAKGQPALLSRNEMDIFLSKCKAELLWTVRPEVVVRLGESVDEDIQKDSEEIRDQYFGLPLHEGMKGLIQYQLEEIGDTCKQGLMTVVFTNSNIHTKSLQSVTELEIQVDKLGAFKSEKQLSLRMHRFWLESEAELLFLQCSAIDDEKHIMLAKSVIERYRFECNAKPSSKTKHVYLVVHMDRSKGTSQIVSQINFLSDWRLVMLDCIECPSTTLPELCSASLHETIMKKKPLNEYVAEQLFWTFTRIGYTSQGRDVDSIRDVLEKMKKSQEFLQILEERICTWISANYVSIDDTEWAVKVACDCEMLQTSSSFVEALERHILSVMNVPLSKIVYQIEVMNILDSYFIEDDDSQKRRITWETMLDNDQIFSIKGVPEVPRNIPEPYSCESKDLCLRMPFSWFLYQNIETTREEFLDSLTLLKGKCDLDEDDDLPRDVFNELLIKQESFVLQKIPDMSDYLYTSWTDDYIEDFCNIVSHTTCSSLQKSKRIEYMKWAITQKTNLQSKDPSELFIRLHSTFWAHMSLFSAEMQLLETCREVLLDDEDDMMKTLTQSFCSDMADTNSNTDDEFLQMSIDNAEAALELSEDPLLSSTRMLPLKFATTHTPIKAADDEEFACTSFEQKPRETDIFAETTPTAEPVRNESAYSKLEMENISFKTERNLKKHSENKDCYDSKTVTKESQLEIIKTDEEDACVYEYRDDNKRDAVLSLEGEDTVVLVESLGEHSDEEMENELDMLEPKYEISVEVKTEEPLTNEKGPTGLKRSNVENHDIKATDEIVAHSEKGTANDNDIEKIAANTDLDTNTEIEISYETDSSGMPSTVANTTTVFTGIEEEKKVHYDENTYAGQQTDTQTTNPVFVSGATALFESFNVNGIPDAETDQSPQDILVDLICKKMLPTRSTLERYKSVPVWQSKVSCVLTLAGQVSQLPSSIHTLRFCNDVAAGLIIPFMMDDIVLQSFGQLLAQNHELDSGDVFQALIDIIKSAPPKASMECQRILSSYFIRCLTSNPNTTVMSNFLLLILDSRLPDSSSSLMKAPLMLALQFEMGENQDIFSGLLHVQSHNLECSEDLHTDAEDDGDSYSSARSITESPFLSDLDQCLKTMFSRDKGEDAFVVLLVDLMEEIYSESIEDTALPGENENEYIDLFLRCHKILIEGSVGFQYIAALAYFKTFILTFARIMKDENLKPNAFAAINAVLNDVEENHVSTSLLRYFMKALGINCLLPQIMKQCEIYKEKLQFLEKMSLSDEYLKACFDSCPLSIHVPDHMKGVETLFESTDEKIVQDRLDSLSNDASNSAKGMLLLYSLALKQFYIPRSYMVLDDTTKRQANFVIEQATTHSLKETNMKLLRCLVGKKDFKVPEFMHGEGSEPSHVLINSFLTSLFGLLLAINTCSSGVMLPFLVKCLLQPNEVMECYLPGFPDNQMQTSTILDDTTSMPEAEFATCQCGHRFAVLGICVRNCMICKHPLTTTASVHDVNFENVLTTSGYVTCADMDDVYFGVRGLSPVACNILHILTKGCLLGSLALGFADASSIQEITSIPEIDVSQNLLEGIECHFVNISRLLNISVYNVGLLLHTTLYHTKELLCENRNPLKSVKDRLVWEDEFSFSLNKIMIKRFQTMHQINRRHVEIHGLHVNCMEQSVHEFDDPSSLTQKERQALTPALFRMRGLPTKENFMYELHVQKDNFPFLMLVLRHCDKLELPIHIFNIVQWQIAAASNANYMMKKHECLNMTVTDFILKSGDENKKEIVRKRFQAFQKSWSALKESVHIENFDRIHGYSKMSDCLILGIDCVVYKVLKELVSIQNTFLDKTLEMATRCHAVRFLSRDPNVSVLPCVQASDVKTLQLLNFEWDNCLLQEESQCDVSYGCGRHIFYDFQSIEKGLAIKILLGKSYINIENSLPMIIFTDELYRNYVYLVRELKAEVKQEHLPSEMIANVKTKKDSDPRMATELLSHLGVIMTLLKKTKGNCEQPLIDYAEKWKILLTRHLPNELLPSPQSSVKLCHVVALHELLEELNSDAIIDALEDEFRDRLDLDQENHFKNMTTCNAKLAEQFLKAIKRFTHRCLSLREADAKQPLLSYLSDESFWPDGMVLEGNVHMAGKETKLSEVLPKSLLVRHVYATVNFVDTELEKLKQDDMKMSKLATSWQSTSKASPANKTVIKKKMATKFRKF